MKEINLTQEFNAQTWVAEWMRITKENPGIPNDEGAMLAWFANAIMAGYDHARRAASPSPEGAVPVAWMCSMHKSRPCIVLNEDKGQMGFDSAYRQHLDIPLYINTHVSNYINGWTEISLREEIASAYEKCGEMTVEERINVAVNVVFRIQAGG